eukprot:763584-Hanusia_phi.AAC.3
MIDHKILQMLSIGYDVDESATPLLPSLPPHKLSDKNSHRSPTASLLNCRLLASWMRQVRTALMRDVQESKASGRRRRR